ncbi:ABC transporter ATP-binding protein [Neptuniibacter sp.]|uniref:ABC transporter ATP-binding protein n=1 Tax=Neptuniibacter sp. TaxID=1962643 RepID=UPI00260238AC|nr:ABC transporter ATP-binding protein [Neptuniibacter sp.]MCP4596301.1 ABC transporter ATP-binding protein [Neptuniibacter sp.]
MSKLAIEISQLSYAWEKDKPILSINELAIARGERIFLKGPSGSGKSTLLNLLGGILTPNTGQIRLLDKEITTMKASDIDHYRSDHTGFIFQQFNLLPYLDLIDNVVLPCRFSKRRMAQAQAKYGTADKGAEELLQRLGLSDPDLLQRSVLELSTGQQQRVAAARALLGSPEIVIADEPTSALDTEHRDQFIELLTELCEDAGSTLLFVSHDAALQEHFTRTEILQPSEKGGYYL